MRDLAPDMALENDAFPFLAMRTGVVAGLAARVFRISFSGELAYEIHVPAHHGLAAWQAIMAAGRPYDITPYGTEAMHLLRAEKGFIIVGQDTDGTVTPLDLGMDWIVSKQKNFIGKRSLSRIDTGRADRKQLVGLLPEDPAFVLPEGAQLVEATQGERPATPSIGHVTSSYWSPNLGHSFALALVKGGRARLGALVYAPLDSAVVPARVVEPVFWDKKGARQNA
jgi:sarcosine oxidase subunit alpha